MELEVHVKPYVGRYPFDFLDELTIREWGQVKRLTGYMPLTIETALEGGDPEVAAVLAAVAMARAGRIAPADIPDVYERMLDSSAQTAITIIAGDQEEADADGPPPESSDASTPSSGAGSRTSSAPSDVPANGSGIPVLATSVLPPVRSGI